MIIHDIVQGTPEWHAWRANHLMASDAPAMMGVSPYKTRDALLREKKLGITKEIDPYTQKRFDDGHRFEALARPFAEKHIGAELYPICGTNGIYGASYDGMVMDMVIGWEHKSMNDDIRAAKTADDLPMVYHVQLAHQFMVSGAEKILFSATKFDDNDTLIEHKHLWVLPNSDLIKNIMAGWGQFQKDLDAYEHIEQPPEVVGKAPEALPALLIEVTGMVQASNLAEFTEHAVSVFQNINTNLETDEDFADAEKTVKWCADVEARLEEAKKQALAQTQSIDALFRAIDSIKDEARQKRLSLDKLVKARKDTKRAQIINDAQTALHDHIANINASLGGNWMPRIDGQFAEAAKNKRTLASLQGAVNDALASAKVKASLLHTVIATNAKAAHDDMHLFPDFAAVCCNEPNIFGAIHAQRRAEFEAKQNRPVPVVAAVAPVVSSAEAKPTKAVDSVVEQAFGVGAQPDPVIASEGAVAAFLNSREWKSAAERNHARAICIEFAKFQAGYREAA